MKAIRRFVTLTVLGLMLHAPAAPAQVGTADLDIDSDNNNGLQTPDRTSGEDSLESSSAKFIRVNDDDDDGNLVVDMDQDGSISEEQGELVPLVLEIVAAQGVPVGTQLSYSIHFDNLATKMRLWRSPTRGPLADTVSSGVTQYVTYNGTPPILTFWIEAIAADDGPVEVEADTNGDGTFDSSDSVLVALRDGTDCWWLDSYEPSVPDGYSCGTVDPLELCGWSRALLWNWTGGWGDERTGGLNVHLDAAFWPPDYPPVHSDVSLSTSPLIPPQKRPNYGGPSPYADRPTLNGVIDLVTGVPLVQKVDFELPFGSAVFRHVRSFIADASPGDNEGTSFNTFVRWHHSQFWDWNGIGWMMSENPLFLIDSTLSLYTTPSGQPGSEKRCYFVPDGHHAIPFIWDDAQKEYIAPPWFDAVLRYEDDDRNDDIPPTRFFVWMYNRTVKYTIRPIYSDIPHAHHSPPDTMRTVWESEDWTLKGVPYYGLVTDIEDLWGNRIENIYCDGTQTECDDPATEHCHECCQNCQEKGQLKAVRLHARAGGQDTVVKTLIYTYRGFGGWLTGGYEPVSVERGLQHALHAVYVFDGAPTVPSGCFTIGASEFDGISAMAESEAITHPVIDLLVSQGAHWTVRASYTYSQGEDTLAALVFRNVIENNSVPFSYGNDWWLPYMEVDHVHGGHLAKARVERKDLESQSSTSEAELYRYSGNVGTTTLMAVFSDANVRSLVDALNHDRDPQLPAASADDLLEFALTDNVPYFDPATSAWTQVALKECADLYIAPWYWGDLLGFWRSDDDESFRYDYLTPDVDEERIAFFWGSGARIFRDRRANSPRQGEYQLYWYHTYPRDYAANPEDMSDELFDVDEHALRAFKYPYRLYPFWYDGGFDELGHTKPIPDPAPRDRHFFGVVIDATTGSNSQEFSRRVVELNAAGFVLTDRTWHDADPSVPPDQSVGYREHIKYDCLGRVTEKASKGWGSVENAATQDSQGMILVFEYEDDDCPCSLGVWPPEPTECTPGSLKAVGVKAGKNGTPYYIRATEHNVPGRPDLVSRMLSFPSPIADLTSIPTGTPTTDYSYVLTTPAGDETPAILEQTVLSPATLSSADGDLTRGIARQKFDGQGRVEWEAVGRVDKESGVPVEAFLKHTTYDTTTGQVYQIRDDTSEASPWSDLYRTSETAALDATTTYSYLEPYGLQRIQHPNGRETWLVYRQVGDELEQWTYNDVARDGGDISALSPVVVTRIAGSRVVSTKRYVIGSMSQDPCACECDDPEDCTPIDEGTPQYDANGRIVGVARSGAGGVSVSSPHVMYDGANIAREQGSDGSITRYTYDNLGRLERTFRGTNDQHDFWGNVDPCPEPPCDYPANLTLVEKRYYGSGRTNAGKLDFVRHFREQAANQYYLWDPDGCDPNRPPNTDCNGYWQGGVVPNENEIGWRTEYRYDWRMRAVWSRQVSEAGTPMSHTVTWLDNLDRAAFVAEYGSDADLSGVDPCNAAPGASFLSASAILGTAPKSLTENMFDADGRVVEARQYDVDLGTYLSTFTFYDHANRPVEVRSPGAPVQQYVYNAKGQQVISRSLADTAGGLVEVARSETKYDGQDRAYETVSYERLQGAAASGPLDSSNSVRTFTRTWYDKANRVIATANYGTNSAGDAFTNSDTVELPMYDGDAPPEPASSGPLVTRYYYDEAGRQSEVKHPNGTITHREYDGLGRMLLMTENAGDADATMRRHTAYQYDGQGRLVKMAAAFASNLGAGNTVNWGATDGSIQVTEFIYDLDCDSDGTLDGATVVDAAGNSISSNKSWIAEVRYPNEATGQPDPANSLSFTYYSDGSVATRSDPRGITLRYVYDELGRRTDVYVDDGAWYAEVPPDPPPIMPLQRLSHIHYEYDPSGRPMKVTAYAVDTSGQTPQEVVVAENLFDYDGFGNLQYDRQQHDGLAAAGSPTVHYGWEFSPVSAGNFNRPTGFTYPPRPGAGATSVVLNYGNNTDDVDSALSRITGIDASGANVAAYSYGGIARRVGATLGNGVAQTVESGSGYPGLDRFGRVIDLHYTAGGSIVQRFQYGYDLSGNRTHARTTYAPTPDGSGGWTAHDNDRSYLYGYDPLDRLIAADFGALNTANTAITPVRTTEWHMDLLGNWTAGTGTPPASVFQELDSDGDGVLDQTRTLHHEVGGDNRIVSVTDDPFGENGPATTAFLHDTAGNLVFDGVFVYQYDALNRLIQVNEPGGVSFPTGGRGRMQGTLGSLLAVYAYDGVGRLAYQRRAQAENQNAPPRLDYYYDGVRRIAERVFSPYAAPQQWPPGCQPCDANCDGSINPFDIQPFINLVSGGTPCSPCAGDTNYNGTTNAFDIGNFTACIVDPVLGTQSQREYVYGPEYVDELVCQIPVDAGVPPANVVYYLQDANYNVTALIGATPSGGGAAPVLTQYVYEPYGQVLTIDAVTPESQPYNTAGHQGLFFEAFGAALTGDSPLQPMAPGWYYNRNRWYSPALGRFTSPDPDETSMLLILSLAFHAQHCNTNDDSVDAARFYRDGLNLFLALHGNPTNALDPLGLYDPFEDVDEWEADRAGNALYVLGTMNDGARLGLKLALDMAASLLPGYNIYDAVQILQNGVGGFWDCVALVADLLPVAKGAYNIGKAFLWRNEAAAVGRVVAKASSWLGKGARDVDVYIGYRNGKAVYVGITNDMARRQLQHGERFVMERVATKGGRMTRNEARSIEQAIIEKNPHFENKRFEISPSRAEYPEAMKFASEWLRKNGLSGRY